MNQFTRITLLSALIFSFQNTIAQLNTALPTDKKSLMKPKLPDVSGLAKESNASSAKKDTTKKANTGAAKSSKELATKKPDFIPALIHEVKQKETIYSISKQYGVSIPELQKANNMTDFSLKIGQKLIIKKGATDSTSKKTQTIAPAIPAKKPYIPEGAAINRVYENGIARVIEGKIRSKKLMALHRYAPIGSLIQIKNMANKNYLTAKVIGKLPPSTDEKVIIRLSPLAYDVLDAKDTQCAVEVSFVSSRKPKVKKSAAISSATIQPQNGLPAINLPVK
jgi:LysM repeat protein